MPVDPDHAIVDKVIGGDQHAYADLVNRHKRYAFTIAFRILQHRPEAEEAAQDAFIKAYNNLKSFNKEAKFSTWLFRIVFNTAITYRRRQKHRFQNIETAIVEYKQEGDDALEKTDKKKYLHKAMQMLNEADRVALSLFYLEEFSLDEIADMTGIPANTIKVRVHRARQKLADELKSILNEEALTL